MRPDETCEICLFSYTKDGKWRCKLIDKIVELRKKGVSPVETTRWIENTEGIKELHRFYLPYLLWFWYRCVTLVEITSPKVFSEGCIKCGSCCKDEEYQVIGLFVNRKDPKSRKKIYMCKHLEYHKRLDNKVDDLGWRCNISEAEKPEICKKFPTGKESGCFESWLRGDLEITDIYLPLCSARWKVITEGLA